MIPTEAVFKTIDQFVENLGTVEDHEERFRIEEASLHYLFLVSPDRSTSSSYQTRYINQVIAKYGSRC